MSDIATTSKSTDIVSGVRLLIDSGVQRVATAAGVAVVVQQLKPGKMLRTKLAARLMEHDPAPVSHETVTRVCAATELIHTASLCHDDVVDNGLIRRALPTLWRGTTSSAAVLIGDLLLCEAMTLLVEADNGRHLGAFVRKVREVCATEVEQELHWRGEQPDEATCLRLARGKTGPLFAFVASVCAPRDDVLSSALEESGYRIGAAYQLADDLLDVIGDEKSCGKTLGTDVARRKFTLAQSFREDPGALVTQIRKLCLSALACVGAWPGARKGLDRFLSDDLQPVFERSFQNENPLRDL